MRPEQAGGAFSENRNPPSSLTCLTASIPSRLDTEPTAISRHEVSSPEHVETRSERAGGAICNNRDPVTSLMYPTLFAPFRLDAEHTAIETHAGRTSGHVETRPERAGGAIFKNRDPVTLQARQATSGRKDILHARSRHEDLPPIHSNNPLDHTGLGVPSQNMSDLIESVPKHVKIPRFDEIASRKPSEAMDDCVSKLQVPPRHTKGMSESLGHVEDTLFEPTSSPMQFPTLATNYTIPGYADEACDVLTMQLFCKGSPSPEYSPTLQEEFRAPIPPATCSESSGHGHSVPQLTTMGNGSETFESTSPLMRPFGWDTL